MAENDLSDIEKLIFDKISKDDAAGLKVLLTKDQPADIYDEHGMTPLQNACFKGNNEMVRMLLDQGADVNSSKHKYNYTALHFAALSGNVDVCHQILEAGVNTQALNSVNRTAAQMAAFLGNYNCAICINNYFPKSSIEYYAQAQPLSEQAIIKGHIVDALYKFTIQININPVRVVLYIQRNPLLLDNLQPIKTVLNDLCEREMKKTSELNEILAFKFHYLAYIVGEIKKLRDKNQLKKDDNTGDLTDARKSDIFELFIRKLLKPNKDGVNDFLEVFLKECIREFPFRECTTFRQIVTSLAQADPPSTFAVIAAAINGQKGFASSVATCSTCGEEKPAKKCSKCKAVQYCDRECQRLHWFLHKKSCNRNDQTAIVKEDNKGQLSEEDAKNLSETLQGLLNTGGI